MVGFQHLLRLCPPCPNVSFAVGIGLNGTKPVYVRELLSEKVRNATFPEPSNLPSRSMFLMVTDQFSKPQSMLSTRQSHVKRKNKRQSCQRTSMHNPTTYRTRRSTSIPSTYRPVVVGRRSFLCSVACQFVQLVISHGHS